jgi:hypothetical protein
VEFNSILLCAFKNPPKLLKSGDCGAHSNRPDLQNPSVRKHAIPQLRTRYVYINGIAVLLYIGKYRLTKKRIMEDGSNCETRVINVNFQVTNVGARRSRLT